MAVTVQPVPNSQEICYDIFYPAFRSWFVAFRRKFPLIPYNTTQARIGGNFQKLLHFPFIPHTTEN
ncbi:hypothetical protein D7V94_17070 [Parablautia intestinalis]|uniref:Uncharacterized protein n=1 Tax=Parablautia intestinalis TaxID=2320100 RepID=A0A3A9ATK5_9FIRM|nr:hypothetical protein D7V94_17070 [Parablautia intestinalis]